jgi:hypothetical protein
MDARAEAALDALAAEQDAVDRAAARVAPAHREAFARLLADPTARDPDLWTDDLEQLEEAGADIMSAEVASSSLEEWMSIPLADRDQRWRDGLRAMRAICHRQALYESGAMRAAVDAGTAGRAKAAPLLRLDVATLQEAARTGVSKARREAARSRAGE